MKGNIVQQAFVLKVALIGMMASGKTTLGKELARALGVPFLDSDDEMVAASGMEIPEIFARHGEAAFRKMERDTIERLLDGVGAFVLSLGGGAYMQPEIREMLKSGARTVFLHVDADELVRRLEGTDIAGRPILAAFADWRAGVGEILAKREALYAGADIRFDAFGHDVRTLARELASLLRNEK